MRAKLRWTIGIVLGLFVAGYLIGGTEGYSQLMRTMRARIREGLAPPTQQQIQRAVTRDSIDTQRMAVAVERARTNMPLGQPAPRARVVALIGGVMIASFGLMYLTGRDRG